MLQGYISTQNRFTSRIHSHFISHFPLELLFYNAEYFSINKLFGGGI